MGSYTRKRKGGARIGKGRFGITYFPPLSCLNPAEQPKGSLVSKVVTRKVARQEYILTKPLREKKYDFTCHPIEACQGEDKILVNGKLEEQWLLFSKYGGKTIAEYIRHFEQEANNFAAMIGALKELREKIRSMNEADKIHHNDISVENITFDEQDTKAYLIDFGEMSVGGQESSDLLLFDQALVNIYYKVYMALQDGGLGSEDMNTLQRFLQGSNNNNNEQFID